MREIVIYLPKVTRTFFEVEGYGLVLYTFVLAVGGRAWVGWLKGGRGVALRIPNLSRREVRVGTKMLLNSTIAAQGTLSLVSR